MLNFLTFIMKLEWFLNLECPLWFIMYVLSSFSSTGFQIQDAEQKRSQVPILRASHGTQTSGSTCKQTYGIILIWHLPWGNSNYFESSSRSIAYVISGSRQSIHGIWEAVDRFSAFLSTSFPHTVTVLAIHMCCPS